MTRMVAKRPSRESAAAMPDMAVLEGVSAAGADYVVALDSNGRVHGWGGGGAPVRSRRLSPNDRPRPLLGGSGCRRAMAGSNSIHVYDVNGRLRRASLVDSHSARACGQVSASSQARPLQRVQSPC